MTAPFPDSKSKDRMLVLPKGPARLKVLSFAVVGAVNTLVDFGVFSIAWIVLGLPLLISNVLAWFVAASGSYVMNCLTTFVAESKGRISLRTYAAFLASGLAALIAGTLVLLIATTIIPVIAAKPLAIAASFACNFSLAHFVIFNNRVKTGSGRSSPLERGEAANERRCGEEEFIAIKRKLELTHFASGP